MEVGAVTVARTATIPSASEGHFLLEIPRARTAVREASSYTPMAAVSLFQLVCYGVSESRVNKPTGLKGRKRLAQGKERRSGTLDLNRVAFRHPPAGSRRPGYSSRIEKPTGLKGRHRLAHCKWIADRRDRTDRNGCGDGAVHSAPLTLGPSPTRKTGGRGKRRFWLTRRD